MSIILLPHNDPKRTSFAFFALDFTSPPIYFRDSIDDREAYSCTICCVFFYAIESSKNFLSFFLYDSFPCISHLERMLSQSDKYFSSFYIIFYGIFEEILHEEMKMSTVDHDRFVDRNIAQNSNTFPLSYVFEEQYLFLQSLF